MFRIGGVVFLKVTVSCLVCVQPILIHSPLEDKAVGFGDVLAGMVKCGEKNYKSISPLEISSIILLFIWYRSRSTNQPNLLK